MAAITKVYLLRVPLESDLQNTLYFSSASAQQNYFAGRVKRAYTDFTYQRKESIIRVPDLYDNIYDCNYCMYQNANYSNKWYYAFIDRLEYINDGRTDVHITTDPVQTWLFDYTVKQCFVEREHVDDDTPGMHTYPEDVEKGEYIVAERHIDSNMQSLLDDLCYVLGSTVNPYGAAGDADYIGGGTYNGIYSGVKYFRYDTAGGLNNALRLLAEAGRSEAITGLFIVPKILAPSSGAGGQLAALVAESAEPTTYQIVIIIPTSYGGYTPHNNKLLTYPYRYLLVSNNQGGNAIFQYEQFINGFTNGFCNFVVKAALAPGGSIRLAPRDYKLPTTSTDPNNEEGLNLGKFPTCNYPVDMYTNWLTQNSINLHTQTANAAFSLAAGIGMAASGVGGIAGVGAIMGGLTNVANVISERYKASLVPPQVNGNLNNGDVTTAAGLNNFTFYKMTIRPEYEKKIDHFFDMFGYKIADVKTPNTNHRAQWWYTKTVDCEIDGNIPQDDMQKIKDAYNRGIRFWRNAANMGNYSLPNGIV